MTDNYSLLVQAMPENHFYVNTTIPQRKQLIFKHMPQKNLYKPFYLKNSLQSPHPP